MRSLVLTALIARESVAINDLYLNCLACISILKISNLHGSTIRLMNDELNGRHLSLLLVYAKRHCIMASSGSERPKEQLNWQLISPLLAVSPRSLLLAFFPNPGCCLVVHCGIITKYRLIFNVDDSSSSLITTIGGLTFGVMSSSKGEYHFAGNLDLVTLIRILAVSDIDNSDTGKRYYRCSRRS